MTTQTDFTIEEWSALQDGLLLAPGNLIRNVGKPGPVRGLREGTALVRGLYHLAQDPKYTDSPFIQQLLAEERDYQPVEGENFPRYEVAMAHIKTAVTIIERVATTEETDHYREILYRIAHHVASASGAGFMGTGKQRFSEAERAYLDDLKTVLGLADDSSTDVA
ncbi:hypothetical protein ACFLYO_07780 [Chloroflexota bacterium]